MDPISLIALVLAVVVGLKLRSVLGVKDATTDELEQRQQQVEKELRQKKQAQAKAEAASEAMAADIPNSMVTVVEEIRSIDPDFSLQHFLDGAEAAYEMVLHAYADSDLSPVKAFLHKSVYEGLADAIETRAKAGTQHYSTLVRIMATDITHIGMGTRKRAEITVKFEGEQLFITKDKEGNPQGSSTTKLVTDEWVFARTLTNQNPNWTVIAI